jgi:hypothetical protein
VRNEEVLLIVKEQRNILREISKRLTLYPSFVRKEDQLDRSCEK